METVGIVAEYNPFHKGHQFHIQETRRQYPSDGVVVVMSGNFTQRGTCAVYDKWTRTRMALAGGADLVLELPTLFATRSAAYFAEGAIRTLAATGIVSALSCGVETDNASTLKELASYLHSEPENYRTLLQKELEKGVTFPVARQRALTLSGISHAEELTMPNNILALHYLQTILQYCPEMDTLFVSRQGSYHDNTIPDNNSSFASASAIRLLMEQNDFSWQQHIPASVVEILQEQFQNHLPPMAMSCYDRILLALLRRSTPAELSRIVGMKEGLEHRITEAAGKSVSSHELLESVKTKRYTYAGIQRLLLHILLNVTESDCPMQPEYIRVLGFNATGQKLLKTMRKTATLPVITRPARQKNLLTDAGRRLLEFDCRATDLYYMGYDRPADWKYGLDYTTQPVQYSC